MQTCTRRILAALALVTACGDSGATTSSTGSESDSDATETDETTTTTGPGTTMGSTGTMGETTSTSSETSDPSTTDPTTTDPSTTDPSTTDPTTTDPSTTGDPVCGDGLVEGDEECDDGADNADDAACTSACAAAVCGDGLVWAGTEECDDGAQNADDAACTSACVMAVCGDLLVHEGVEQCDDGNADETDACTSLCAAPACDDGIVSGDETDVDCGGDTCNGCQLGASCVDSQDCNGGVCNAQVCAIPADCADLLALDPQAQSGIHVIDPDGDGGADGFPAYCEMDTDGGGWTLILKVDGRLQTFPYSAAIWTDATFLNEDNPAFDHVEGKLQGWATVPVGEVLVGLEFPIDDNQNPPVMNYVTVPVAAASLMEVFAPDVYIASNLGRDTWKTLVANGSLQFNCNMEGFNVIPNPNPVHHSVRIGIVGNNENDCATTDSRIGIGGVGTACATLPDPAGNFAGCGGDNGNINFTAFGAVFVRP